MMASLARMKAMISLSTPASPVSAIDRFSGEIWDDGGFHAERKLVTDPNSNYSN